MDYKRLRSEIGKLKRRLQISENGLNINDYNRLKKLVLQLGKDKSQQGIAYHNQVKEILDSLTKSGVPFGLTEQNTSYIVQELPVLPFVFANRAKEKPTVKKKETQKEKEEQKEPQKLPIFEYHNGDQFKFNKQMDDGIKILELRDNTVKVVTINTIEGARGIAKKLDIIQYIMEEENLNKADAIAVIIGTYDANYELSEKLVPKVEHYKEALRSTEFAQFLEVGRRIAEGRGLSTQFYDKMEAFHNRAVKQAPEEGPTFKKE